MIIKKFKFFLSGVLFVVALTLLSCFNPQRDKLESIQFIINFPVIMEETPDEVQYVKDTITIYYFKDFVLYKLSPKYEFETERAVDGTQQYFLYKKSNPYGYLFDKFIKPNPPTKSLVDSFLQKRGKKGQDVEVPPDSIWKLSSKNELKERLIESYSLIEKRDENYPDTIKYFYNGNLSCDFSFSKKLDKERGMKLSKIIIVYNSKKSTKYNREIAKRELSMEISENKNLDNKSIVEFIETNGKMLEN